MLKRTIAALAAAAVATAGGAFAADTVKVANVIELSGAGATVGTNWRNALHLAIDEINAAGGILGKKIEVTDYDTQTKPDVSRAQVQKALDEEPVVIFGPIYSGSIKVNASLAKDAGVPQLMGGEASDLTQQGNPFLFRTSLSQAASMPKIANYIRDAVKAKKVAVLWVNNDFGKGGRDNFVKEMKARGIEVVADLSTESGQVDFASDVVKLKSANPDAIFVYTNEEESARFLREARKQGIDKPLIGETTLLNQKTIELAGEAANGVKGHVGLSADAPVDGFKTFAEKYRQRYGSTPDHNAIKAYTAAWVAKAVYEKVGKFDTEAFAKTLHGLTLSPAQVPGVLIETTWDQNGDVDRVSFLAEVVEGKQKIVETLPKLGK